MIVIPYVVAFGLAASLIYSLVTGKISLRGRTAVIKAKENPTSYWLTIALGVALLAFEIWLGFAYSKAGD